MIIKKDSLPYKTSPILKKQYFLKGLNSINEWHTKKPKSTTQAFL